LKSVYELWLEKCDQRPKVKFCFQSQVILQEALSVKEAADKYKVATMYLKVKLKET